MKWLRVWAMPNKDTFSVAPIGAFVKRYLGESTASVDPFARNKRWATVTNDLDPGTGAEHHFDAEDFLGLMRLEGRMFDLAIFDPPYSPRQIAECYKGFGRTVTTKDTQSSVLYARARDALVPVLAPEAVVLTFGWSTNGMGKKHGFEIEEIMLVAHGGAHNDTICMAERRL